MASLRDIHQLSNLEAHAEADGFEHTGNALFLFFVTGRGTDAVRKDFVLCTSTQQAKREMKARRAAGWECCWKAFGGLYLPRDGGTW